MGGTPITAQPLRTVEIIDVQSAEPLLFATVLAEGAVAGITNEFGFVKLPCADSVTSYTVQYFGTVSEVVLICTEQCDQPIRVAVEASQLLREVTVRGSKGNNLSSARYTPALLTRSPSLLGQPDVLRGLALLPGISTGQEGSVGLFVRGGTPDQNLLLLDDAPVFNPTHLGGLLSVFNDATIASVGVYKTTPPIQYGNRLSSLIDVRIKSGSTKKWKGRGSIGLVSADVLVEGPIVKDKTSLVVGARGGYFALLNVGRSRDKTDNLTDYQMYDVVAKLTHALTASEQLSFSFYRSLDNYTFYDNAYNIFARPTNYSRVFTGTNNQYANTTLSVRYHNELSEKTTLTAVAYTAAYASEDGFEEERYRTDELVVSPFERTRSDFGESGLNVRIRQEAFRGHAILGGAMKRNTYDPLNITFGERVGATNFTRGAPALEGATTTWTGYTAWNHTSTRFDLATGARINLFSSDGYQHIYPEWRIRISRKLASTSQLSFSLNQTAQDLHQVTAGGLGFSTDTYVSPSDELPLQNGRQADLSWQTDWKFHQVGLAVYGRTMKNLVAYRSYSDELEDQLSIEGDLLNGQGQGLAYGLEVFHRLTREKYSFQFSYSLSRNRRRFAFLNDNEYFPFRYDRTHDMAWSGRYAIGRKGYSLSGNFIFQTGIAVTSPVARVTGVDYYGGYRIVPSINNARFPSYHRLDLGIIREWTGKRGNANTLSLNVYNTYNRVNPVYYTTSSFATGSVEEGNLSISNVTRRVGFFGLLPTLYFSHQFKLRSE